jgi:ribonuclease HI
MSDIHNAVRSVVFFWVPGHTNLPASEAAEAAAEKAALLHGDLTSIQADGSDVYNCLFCCFSYPGRAN